MLKYIVSSGIKKKKKEKVVSALNLKALLYRHYSNTLYLRLFGL